MSFEDINNEIRTKGASWVNLKNKGDKVAGKIVDVESRNQSFKGKTITVTKEGPTFGQPRKEWVFTLETTEGGTVKVALKESGQWAVTGALAGRKLEKGGHLQIEMMEEGVRSEKQPEFKAVYSNPTFESPFEGTTVAESDEPPF